MYTKKGSSSKQYTIYGNRSKFLPCWHVPQLAYWHKQELHKERDVNPGITPIVTLMPELPKQCLCTCKIFSCWHWFFVHTGKWNLFIPSSKLRSSFEFPWNRLLILILPLENFLQAHVLPPFLGSDPISVQVSTGTEFRGPHSTKVKWVNTRWILWQLWLQQIYAGTSVDKKSLLLTSSLVFVTKWNSVHLSRKLFSSLWLYSYLFLQGNSPQELRHKKNIYISYTVL